MPTQNPAVVLFTVEGCTAETVMAALQHVQEHMDLTLSPDHPVDGTYVVTCYPGRRFTYTWKLENGEVERGTCIYLPDWQRYVSLEELADVQAHHDAQYHGGA